MRITEAKAEQIWNEAPTLNDGEKVHVDTFFHAQPREVQAWIIALLSKTYTAGFDTGFIAGREAGKKP